MALRSEEFNHQSPYHLGIDIWPYGVSPNDACDSDTGANARQNFPVLTSAIGVGGNTTITGTLNSTPNQTFTIDFYSNAVCDTNGYGEGKTYLGSTTVSTGASCNSRFTAIFPVQLTTELMITATGTAPRNTRNLSLQESLRQALAELCSTSTMSTSECHCTLKDLQGVRH